MNDYYWVSFTMYLLIMINYCCSLLIITDGQADQCPWFFSLAGRSGCGGSSTANFGLIVGVQHHYWDFARPTGIPEFQNKLFHGPETSVNLIFLLQKPQRTWYFCCTFFGSNLVTVTAQKKSKIHRDPWAALYKSKSNPRSIPWYVSMLMVKFLQNDQRTFRVKNRQIFWSHIV